MIREMLLELQAFRNGSYPKFLISDSVGDLADEIPVFMFHLIQPEIFEAQLIYLAENGYNTITCDEFYRIFSRILTG